MTMPQEALRYELERATDFAREAGQILLSVYGTGVEVSLKGVDDPVTVADQRANAFLVQELRRAFPGDAIVAEEGGEGSNPTAAERCWFVDPLDGTKEFISQNGEFSVMLGLAIGGRATLGVVYQPVGDRLVRGVVGAGAELLCGGVTAPLRVSDVAEPAALRLVASRSHRPAEIDELVARLGITQQAQSGSVGLKIGLIARQEADLYVHVSDRSSLWDACGPDAILHAAGGRFTDLAGQPIEYVVHQPRNRRGIFACNASAFAAVSGVVHELGQAAGLV